MSKIVMTITERDRRLLRFVACCAAIAVSAQLLIRPALVKREELKADLDALETQQAEWQEKNKYPFDHRPDHRGKQADPKDRF